VARKQRETEEGARDKIRSSTSDLIPPVKSHLLKFPPFPKIAPPAGDQPFNT
jgi:hypothetical protein